MNTDTATPVNEETTEEVVAPEEAVTVEAPVEEAEAPVEDAAVAALNSDLKRLQAEYVNYRARVERDRAVAGQVAREKTISALLPVLDDINAARNAGDLVEGPFVAIAAKLDHILSQQGVVRVAEVGVEFDPTIHDALTRAAHADIPEDHVSMIINDGYFVGDKLIRAARVVVSAGA